jgi:hypothetical protein
VTKQEPNNKQLAGLTAAVLVPVTATAYVLGFWLSKPLATAISIFAWAGAVYWIPPRPKMSPWRWLIIVSLMSVTTFILILFGLDPFCRK